MEHNQGSTDRLIGQTLDARFRVDRFIASGGMGAVYQGTQLSVEKPVAIKVLHDRYADEIALERFMREAQNISRLAHPNIVSLVDFGRSGDTTYLVMEYIDGVSLGSLSAQMSICEEALIELLLQTSAALVQAHAQGIIHRDLKPDNLLLIRQASGAIQVKLVDFGIARTQSQGLTGTGHILGTPWYMSPEQAMNRPVDGRSDLFALGVIAFELVTGRLPFEADETLATLMLICNEPTPPIVPGAPGVWPDKLLLIIKKLLSKDPEERFRDALELIEALEQVRQRHHIPTLRLTPKQSLASLFTLPTITLKAHAVAPRTTSRLSPEHLKPILALLTLAIVVMLGVIGYMLSMRKSPKVNTVEPVATRADEAPVVISPSLEAPTSGPGADLKPEGTLAIAQARRELQEAYQGAQRQATPPPRPLAKKNEPAPPQRRPPQDNAQSKPAPTTAKPITPTAVTDDEAIDPLQERLNRLKNSRRE